jgi:outer membrane protein assembly factor BamD
MKKYIYIVLIILGFSSCSEYQKAIKSEDLTVKFNQAAKQYEKGKYYKALTLFEQMAPSFRGNPQAEKMFYMFSQSYYKTKQYYLSGYQFESFAAGFPKSDKLEEASFLGAKSYSMLSPMYSLDQTDTDKAIDKLQSFIDAFPNSSFLPEANIIVKELREKIEKKAYENAYGYNKISDFKSALIALDNFIIDYPGTPYKEKALYYKLDSAYQLAINSIPSKMEERLIAAKAAHASLLKFNSNTEYKQKADDMLARINTDLKQFSK